MATVFINGSILHGCDVIGHIYNDSFRMKQKGHKFEAFIYMVGCYAAATGDHHLKVAWNALRRIYNYGFTVSSLYEFRCIYNGVCNRLAYLFGNFVWHNTLSMN